MKTLKGNVIISWKRLRRLPMMNGKYLFEDVHVTGNFYCYYNPVKFTTEDVRKVCNVRGGIYV